MGNRGLILLSERWAFIIHRSLWVGRSDAPVNKDITEEIFNMRFSNGYVNPAVLRSERWVICFCLSSPAQWYLSRIDHLSGGRYIPVGGLHRHQTVIMKFILCLPSFYLLSAVRMLEDGRNKTHKHFSSWASILEFGSPSLFSQEWLWTVRN